MSSKVPTAELKKIAAKMPESVRRKIEALPNEIDASILIEKFGDWLIDLELKKEELK